MFFIIEGTDGTDPEAHQRRQAARDEHLTLAREMKTAGKLLFAAALTDKEDHMIGSVLLFQVESEREIEAYLAQEPYVAGNVWRSIEVRPCKVPPFVLA